MIIHLPTIDRKYNEETDEVTTTKKHIPFRIDTSVYVLYRYERLFREEVGKEFNQFTKETLKNSTKVDFENFLNLLRLVYCYLESKDVPTFDDFLKLFDFSVMEELGEKLTKVVKIAYSDASKN